MMAAPELITIGILGGTGNEGRGLAFRLAKSGYRILIGSRVEERACVTASELNARLGKDQAMEGMTNARAASTADVIILSVPFAAHRQTLESIKDLIEGKTLIDVTVPLVPPQVNKAQMPPAGSAALEARQILGKAVEVATAFQNISYKNLLLDDPIECDVLVCGTSRKARAEALRLVDAAGLVGWDAGPLENSMVVEGLTSILIGINQQHGGSQAGIKIVGIK